MSITDFETRWQLKIENEILKSFPNDFINGESFETLNMPEKPLMKGSELFGNYEIIDIDGVTLLSTESLDKIKFILYANRIKPVEICVPTNESDLKNIVKNYEKHLDNIVKMIVIDYKIEFPDSDKFINSSAKIFQLLNLRRH